MNARQQSTTPPTSITPISSSPPQSQQQQQQGSQPPPPPSQQQPPPGSVIRLRIHHDQVSLLRSSSPTPSPSPPTTTTTTVNTTTATNTTTTSSSSSSSTVVAPTIPTTPIAPQSSTPITLITANSSSIANSLRSNTMMSGTMYKQTARKSITTPPRKQLCSIPLSYSSSYSIIGAAQSSVHNDEISSTSSSSSDTAATTTTSLNSGEIHSLQRRKRRRTISTSPGNDSETEESDHERNDTIMMSDESAKSKRSNEVIVADQSSFDSSSSSSAATTAPATKYVTAPRNVVLSSFNARSSSASSAAAAAAFAGSVTEATATAVLSSSSSGGGSGEASLVSGVRGGLRKNPRRREVYDPLTGESAPAAILVSDSESEEVVTSQRRARRSNRSNTSTNSTGSTGSGSSSQDSMNLTIQESSSSSQDMSPGVDQVVSSQDNQRLSSEAESERVNSGTIEERTSPGGDSGRTMGPKRIANSDDIRRKITFVSKAPKRHHESAVASAPITLVPMSSSAAAAPATVPLASVATIATPPTPTVGAADVPPVEKVRIQLFQNDRDFLDVFGSSFRINGSFTDYTIVFKHSGNRFRTHRIVLAGHSSLLRSMLTNEAQEVLEVDDSVFNENVFFTIIGLLYPGSSVRVRYNQIPHMLMIANHFGLHKLIQVLVTVFSHHLNDNIVLSCWNLKYTDETRPLIEIAESYIQKQNFKLILKEHKHVMLSFDGWYRLLQSIPVNTDNALDLIDSISAWVKHDRPNRAQYLARLMQLIQGT